MILNPADFRHYIDRFNSDDQEDVVNLIPNAAAWEWISTNAPLLECPDKTIEEIYYFRWWTYRKHIKQTTAGSVVSEFILPVKHAGAFNTISCALGHHLAEGRWLRDQRFLDEYIRFWFRGNDGARQPHFHKYSQWIAAAIQDRAAVTGDMSLAIELLDDLVADYSAWENEKRRPDGLFWQFDVWDGMEESISGSRTHRNARPTINSYMFASAVAIAEIARLVKRAELADTFATKAAELKHLVQERLWDRESKFFKAQTSEGALSDAREAIGFIPWCFDLPDGGRGYEVAWKQLVDSEGFCAPCGITTAERRHQRFRSHGVGRCEWDGAVWPFATSQTLAALANVLRHYDQPHVTKQHFLDAVRTYANAQHRHGRPYIGEYHDERTGEWLKGDNPRSRYYNHSTFCDLIIGGIVGVVPRRDDVLELHPLLPADAWDYFCLGDLSYHGRCLTIVWDRRGTKYGRGAGLSVWSDGSKLGESPDLKPLKCNLG